MSELRAVNEKDAPRFVRMREKVALWTAMLGSAAAALLMVAVGFSAVHGTCVINSKVPVHIVGVLMFALGLYSAFLAYRYWQRTGREWRADIPGAVGRSRLMAGVGLMNAALFLPLIVAAWAVTAFFLPCQGT